ncbi:glycerophosphodiester phosphodiesterase family protein [Novosphingobium beihaiensis]|uniref:Glycerophosphodiester phosphodiesterase family protein n=1 Tax=Novosphingobium beihaiensis TaxID=2930389 RepID=A0ABT0BLE9_9SPHN|nr:glycerophosphodiester phosphodiesterase family protein [Novosphingobium beihaiensis]MCJ2185783.1 glycerophosphodiester phosphodiesterase family protein [Novosphingobium beihaiensis]
MIPILAKVAAKAALAGVLAMAATPVLAAPFCGKTRRIAALERHWANPAGRMMIAAHRGGHLKAPENSLAAIDEAVAAKADFVETDVHVTTDGVPYIMHDHTVERMTGGIGGSEDISYADLRKLRLKGTDAPPPTLQQFLMHTCGRVLVDLDMKTDRVGPVIAVVQALGMLDQVEMFDSDSTTLRAASVLAPGLQVMTRLRTETTLDAINRDLARVRIVHGDPQSLTRAASRAIAAMPARIWANALGDTDESLARHDPDACDRLKGLRAMGVTNIQTDYPALLRRYLKTCGLAGRVARR